MGLPGKISGLMVFFSAEGAEDGAQRTLRKEKRPGRVVRSGLFEFVEGFA
jgi:hypothetical protein